MNKKGSINRQILIVNMAIGLVILVVYFLSFLFLNRRLESDSRKAADDLFNSYTTNFELEYTRLAMLMELCQNDRSFIFSAANRLEIGNFVDYSIEASDKMSLVRYAMPYTTNIYLYVKNNDQIIRTNKLVTKAELYLPMLEKKLAPDEKLPDFKNVEDGFHLYRNYAIYTQNIYDYGCLILEVDTNKFCNLSEISAAIQCDFVVLDDADNLFTATDYNKVENVMGIYKEKSNAYIDGINYQINYTQMPKSEYKIYMLYHNAALEQNRQILFWFLLFAVVMLAGACALLVLLNQRIYRPLKSILRKISFTSHNEMDAITEKIEELMSENAKMSRQISSQQELHENIALGYAFRSNAIIEPHFCEPLKDLYGSYRIIEIAIQDGDGHCPDFFAKMDSYIADAADGRAVRIDAFCHAYLIPDQDKEGVDILSLITEYLSEFKINDRVFVFAGASDVEDDEKKIAFVYQQAHSRMLDCVIPNRQRFVICTKSDVKESTSYPLSFQLQNTVAQAVLKGDKDEITSLLSEIMFSTDKRLSEFLSTYQSICTLIAVLIASLSDDKGTQWKTQRARPVYNPIYMYKCVQEDCERLFILTGGGQQTLRYQIIEYIRSNYDRPLSLESIAEEFGITSVYLSSWFKKNIGINLSVYLSNYRMEKAKEMLINNKAMKIADVAEKVGIISTSTFIRQFKNYTGITPDQFRKLNN